MAIIISSKNIYEKNNPKIKKNIIEKINISAKKVFVKETFDTTVHSHTLNVESYPNTRQTTKFSIPQINGKFYAKFIREQYCYIEGEFDFSPKKELSHFKNLKDTKIDVKRVGNVETGTCSIEIDYVPNDDDVIDVHDFDYTTTITGKSIKTGGFELPSLPFNPYNSSGYIGAFMPQETVEILRNGENYTCKYKVISKYQVYYLSREELNSPDTMKNEKYFFENMPYEGYFSTSIQFSFFGDLYELNFEDETIDILGENQNTKEIFKIDGNNLLQTTNRITIGEQNKNATQEIYSQTLEKYKNGKETATLLCSISEYYNEQGELAISTKDQSLPMQFEIGNEVVPMIMNNKGEDVPMSKDKVFEVVGSEIYYDGAVWQKLTLLQV